MALIAPFRAWRYDPNKVSTLDDVTCPPYDVIGKAKQREFYARHPWNIIRLELGEDLPQDSPTENRYTRASKHLEEWRSSGILIPDLGPCLYLYHHRFRDLEGNPVVRKGIMALLRLEPFGQGAVFPHEETFPNHKKDRLRLLRACRAQFNPIFSIFPDPEGDLGKHLECPGRSPDARAVDEKGVEHLLWVLDDPSVIRDMAEKMADRPVFIADGHHRYETSLLYQKELGVQGDPEHPANWTFVYLSPMEDPGLMIFPTHKLLKFARTVPEVEFLEGLSKDFEVVEIPCREEGPELARQELKDLMKRARGSLSWVIGLAISGRASLWALRPKQDLYRGDALSHVPDALRGLDVTFLHELILKKRLNIEVKGNDEARLMFSHDVDEALDLVRKGKAQIAFLMNPIPVTALRAVAFARCKMPPKATYFYPKLLSGLAVRTLDEDDRVVLPWEC